MLKHLGETDAESSRSRSKERTIKAKPRPKFSVRKRGTKASVRVRQTTVIIV